MNLTRQILFHQKDKYKSKMANKTQINTVHDVLTINESSRNAPASILKFALKDVILKELEITKTKCFELRPNTQKKYFKDTVSNDHILFLYIHGGGFCTGFPLQGTFLMKTYMKYFGCTSLAIDYPLSPENKYPIALDKIIDVYKEIIKTYKPKNIILAGESAGSNLAMSLMLKLKENNLPLPACALLPSGFYDLSCEGETYKTNDTTDPSLTHVQTKHYALAYVFGEGISENKDISSLKIPFVSPIYGDLKGLPPLFFSVCKDEVLYDDTFKMVEKCKKAKVRHMLNEAKDCFHAYMTLGDFFPESKKATMASIAFVLANTKIQSTYKQKNRK